MTDIFIDATTDPYRRYITHRYFYCDLGKYPNGKVIDPITDKHAGQTEKGDWICGYCLTEKLLKLNNRHGL